jgi:hypothetical protein
MNEAAKPAATLTCARCGVAFTGTAGQMKGARNGRKSYCTEAHRVADARDRFAQPAFRGKS